MSDGGLTLLALHFDGDVQVGTRRLGKGIKDALPGEDGGEDALPGGGGGEDAPAARTDGGGGGRSRGTGLAAAGALVVLAVAAGAAWRHLRPR